MSTNDERPRDVDLITLSVVEHQRNEAMNRLATTQAHARILQDHHKELQLKYDRLMQEVLSLRQILKVRNR